MATDSRGCTIIEQPGGVRPHVHVTLVTKVNGIQSAAVDVTLWDGDTATIDQPVALVIDVEKQAEVSYGTGPAAPAGSTSNESMEGTQR